MTTCRKLLSFLSVLLISITPIFAIDEYQELDGNLDGDLDITFSVYLQSYRGIILYAVDSENTFLLELKEEENKNFIFIKFYQYLFTENIQDICGCAVCSKIYLVFNLRYMQGVLINCNDRGYRGIYPNVPEYQYDYNHNNHDRYGNKDRKQKPKQKIYPIPPKKIYIQMGNSSLYHRYNDNINPRPSDKLLIGCLDEFKVNDRPISVETGGKYLLPSCSVDYIETLCDGSYCHNDTKKSHKRFDCSDEAVNAMYCTNELFNYENKRQSYLRNKNNINLATSLKLEWKQKVYNQSKTYSLMELELSGKSLIQFYISAKNEMVMRMRRNSFQELIIIFQVKIPREENHILLMEFKENTTIKISVGIDKYVHRLEILKPVFVNVGFFQNGDNFSEFEGALNFRYNSNQFKLVEEESRNEFDLQIGWYFLGLILGVFGGIALVFGSMFYMIKRNVIIINWPPCYCCPLPIRNIYYRVTSSIRK